jgi:hypothetical protein
MLQPQSDDHTHGRDNPPSQAISTISHQLLFGQRMSKYAVDFYGILAYLRQIKFYA